MAFRPLEDRVFVRTADAETKSAGGILIPESTQLAEKAKMRRGFVIAIGPGKTNPKTHEHMPIADVRVGDEVVYDDYYAGVPFTFEDKEHRAVRAEDILCVIEREVTP